MILSTTFITLPNEILHLISEEFQDPGSLSCLPLISKRSYEVFNRRLYESVRNMDQLVTLALSEVDRLPLNGAHPASFVKDLEIKYHQQLTEEAEGEMMAFGIQETSQAALFRKQASSALNNVLRYCAPLHHLRFYCDTISLPEVFGGLDLTTFDSLRELAIGCPFPKRSLKQSLDIFESLCRGCVDLTSLKLDWYHVKYFPDPNILARLMERIPKVCPNVTEIGLYLPGTGIMQEQPCERIQQVMDNADFSFPLLKTCRIQFVHLINCKAFFLRHPAIEYLEHLSDFSDLKMSLGVLPNLRHFNGYVLDYITLYKECAPPIECLEVNFLSDWHCLEAEEEFDFLRALLNTQTIRKLIICDLRNSPGMSLDLIQGITDSCPKLRSFSCIVDTTYDIQWHMRQVYSAIIPKLDHLEHLSICFQYSSFDDEHAFDLLHSLHFEALSSDSRICCHRALKTVQIDVRLPSSDPDLWYTEDQFYFMKKKDKIVPASSLDSYYKF